MMHKIFYTIPIIISFLFSSQLVLAQDADFYNVDSIQEIKISFEADNWPYLLDSLRFNGDEMLVGDISINGTALSEVGIRIKRDRSFLPNQKKNSLFIRLDHTDPEQNYQGVRALMLSISLRDPSMIREVAGLEIARKYMPAPRANFAKVMINQDYYGLFVNLEPIDDLFLERNFQDTNGHLFYSNPPSKNKMNDGCLDAAYGNLMVETGLDCYDKNFDLVRGQGFQAISKLITTLNLENEKISEVLDEDATLWMHAFNNVVANLASYSGKEAPNYFLYELPNGQFTPIIWNTNYLFGSFKNIGSGSDLGISAMEKLDPYLHINNSRKPLIRQLLNNPDNKKRYLSHMRVLLYEEFLSGKFEKRVRGLQEMINVPLINDRNRYYSSSDFEKSLVATIGRVTKIPGPISFMNNRNRFLKKHPDFLVIPPEISNLKYKTREKYSRERIENYNIQVSVSAFTSNVAIYYRFDESDSFSKMMMKDDGKSYDEAANDKIYGIIIPPQNGSEKIEFYIRAENARSLSYHPVRYMYELEEIVLADLNK